VREAERILERLGNVEECYRLGAAAALFDILHFCTYIAAPLPFWIVTELRLLAIDALRGDKPASTQGSDSPLAAHRAALVKRLRWATVNAVLKTGEQYAHEAEIVEHPQTRIVGPRALVEWGANPTLWAEWEGERPDATRAIMRACEIAHKQHWEGVNIEPRAVHVAWREVENALNADDSTIYSPWPGRFFVPTSDTLDALGWGELAPLVTQYGGSDFPDFGMV